MPGQRHSAASRRRASWLPRLAGLGVVVVLAAAGVTAYLLAFHPASHHDADPLPTRVLSYQSVGLVVRASGPGSSPGALLQLLASSGAPRFAVLSQAQEQSGSPQWTADQMAGGTYIFIYLKTGQCLAATGPAGNAKLELQHCDLSAVQRWRRTTAASLVQGHDFYQYANLADRSCLSQAGQQSGQTFGAGLSPCQAGSMAQLIAFWWSSL